MGEEIMKKGHLKDYVQQTRTYEMAVKWLKNDEN